MWVRAWVGVRARARVCVRARAPACVRVRACACVSERARVRGWVGGWVGGCACVCARACPRVCLRARAKGTWRNDGKWIENRWEMRKMDGKLMVDVWKMDVCMCASKEM